MNFSEYQKLARSTAVYPERYTLLYPVLGLAGEAGEVAEKVKKMIRDDNAVPSAEFKEGMLKELGDCLWYIAMVANDAGINMDDLAKANVKKLQDRIERGVIQGSGDDR